MPQCNLAVKDTVTGLWLKVYAPSLQNCQFAGPQDAICVDDLTEPQVTAILTDLNSQAGVENRFIGSNPPPR